MSEQEWVIDLSRCFSSLKYGIPLNQIESDLFNVTGTRIPYKKLGYPSLEACLSSSDQFTIHNHDGVSIVYAVVSEKSQHLLELVKKQKSEPPKIKSVSMNKRKVSDPCTAENGLNDISESKNLKEQSFKELKIYELEKKGLNQYDYSFLFDEITKYHGCNNLKELLLDVKQWDIDTPNQCKSINKFECLVCCFKTDLFIDWKLHIMSILHLLNCQGEQDLFSFVCFDKGCKVLLYGPQESLNLHKAKHSDFDSISSISLLMVEVMERFIQGRSNIMYFCSNSKKFNEDTIHCLAKKFKINSPAHFFCSSCKVDFYSSPEMIDYHSLTVEHLTLKCYDKLLLKGKTNFKNMKLSTKSNENGIINDSLPLPNSVKNTSLFKNSDCMENDDKHVPIVQVKKSQAKKVIGSTPTVIFNEKPKEANPVNSETTSNKIIDRKLQSDIALTSVETGETASDNATNFNNEIKPDEDWAYGNYVTQRLKNISDSTVKEEIKLEIDYLFYVNMKNLSLRE